MPFNFRLNVQNIFRRLGIQTGARLPQLEDNVRMTMQLTDLSRLIPAPIEPRGLAGINLDSAPPSRPVVQLKSLSAGGLFVETILYRVENFAADDNLLIQISLTDLGMTPRSQQNIGGSPIFSQFTAQNVLVGIPTGVPVPGGGQTNTIAIPAGIFVPNQALFTMMQEKIQRLDVALIYRELPSVEEVG